MPFGGSEFRVEADEVIEGCARAGGITFAELRARKPQHEIRVMLIQAVEIRAVFVDRLVVAPSPRERFGIALAACDIACYPGFAFVAAQVRMRIERLFDSACGALRRAAAVQVRNDFHYHVRDRTGEGQQREHPYPDLVSTGLDAMDDEQDLDSDREYEEPGHASLARRERPQAYWAATVISTLTA